MGVIVERGRCAVIAGVANSYTGEIEETVIEQVRVVGKVQITE